MKKKFIIMLFTIMCFNLYGENSMKNWTKVQSLSFDLNKDGKNELIQLNLLCEIDNDGTILRDDGDEWNIVTSLSNKILFSSYIQQGIVKIFPYKKNQLGIIVEDLNSMRVYKIKYSKLRKKYILRRIKRLKKYIPCSIIE